MPETPHLESRRYSGLGPRLNHHYVTQRTVEDPQEQRYQPGNNRKGNPLAETEALGGVVHRAILQAGEPQPLWQSPILADSTLVLFQIAVFHQRANYAAPSGVTKGAIEWGWPLPPSVAGNSVIDAFPLRPR